METDAATVAAGNRTCAVCGAAFYAPAYRVKRGHGTTCSRACASRKAASAFVASRPKPTDAEIVAFLWSNVEKRGEDECWPWIRRANAKGRGVLNFQGFRALAPRVAYFAGSGEWPPSDLFVCHTCDNPACCNPAHLWPGTPKDNAGDMIRKGRAGKQNMVLTACKHGHSYTPENTYQDKRGRRSCVRCRRLASARLARAKRLAVRRELEGGDNG